MNMLVSTTIAGAAIPSPTDGITDPILGAIETHRRAFHACNEEHRQTDRLESIIPRDRRRTLSVDEICETDDPRWIAHERELHRLHEAEANAECELAYVEPTTVEGILALLKYAREVERTGIGWRNDLIDPDESEHRQLGRSWYYFVHQNIVNCLERTMA